MAQFFAKDWTGAPFVMFGPPHIVALILVLLANLSLVRLRRLSQSARTRFRYALATLLIVNETAWHWWNFSTGQWTLQTMLPLHLCSALVWVSAQPRKRCSRPTRGYMAFRTFASFRRSSRMAQSWPQPCT